MSFCKCVCFSITTDLYLPLAINTCISLVDEYLICRLFFLTFRLVLEFSKEPQHKSQVTEEIIMFVYKTYDESIIPPLLVNASNSYLYIYIYIYIQLYTVHQ